MNTLVRENHAGGERQATEQFIAPAATVLENADGYTLEVEMPGVNKEGLEISVENNEMTILGRRSLPAVEGTLIHRESRPNDFQRPRQLLFRPLRKVTKPPRFLAPCGEAAAVQLARRLAR